MPERARVSLGLSGASGTLQLAAWALFFLPFATLVLPPASGANLAELTTASGRDPVYVPFAIGGLMVAGLGGAGGATVLAGLGLTGRTARPRAAAGLALLGALVVAPFALAPSALASLDGLRTALAVLALAAALAALALAGRGPLRGTPG